MLRHFSTVVVEIATGVRDTNTTADPKREYMQRLALVITLIVVSCMHECAAGDFDDTLAHRQDYQEQLKSVEAEYQRELTLCGDEYLRNLEALQKELEKASDVDALRAVEREKEGFASDRRIPGGALRETPPGLRSLQTSWLGRSKNAELLRTKRVLALSAQYLAALETIKKKLLEQGKVARAFHVRREIDRVGSSTNQLSANATSEDEKTKETGGLIGGWDDDGGLRRQNHYVEV